MYLLGLCPKSDQLFVAGEDCRSETRGMFLVTTNGISPFAVGRWTDTVGVDKNLAKLSFTQTDPLQRRIDPWGKVEGNFNNLDHFPTPYSQDPNGLNWPYFDRRSVGGSDEAETSAKIVPAPTEQSDSDSLQNLKEILMSNTKIILQKV